MRTRPNYINIAQTIANVSPGIPKTKAGIRVPPKGIIGRGWSYHTST